MINNNEVVFIYNLCQADFYFSKGILPLNVGVGSKKILMLSLQRVMN